MELSDNVKYNLITRINNVDLTIVNGLCSPDVLNQTVGPARIFPRQPGRPHVGERPRPYHEVTPQIFSIFSMLTETWKASAILTTTSPVLVMKRVRLTKMALKLTFLYPVNFSGRVIPNTKGPISGAFSVVSKGAVKRCGS